MTEWDLTPLQQAAAHGIRRVTTVAPPVEELAESTTNAILDALPSSGWWIDETNWGEPAVWKKRPGWPASPLVVATRSSAGPDVWPLLVALVPEKAAPEPTLLTCTWSGCGREYDGADEIFCSEECRAEEDAAAEDERELLVEANP